MAKYRVVLVTDGPRLEVVANKIKTVFGDCTTEQHVLKLGKAESRADRLNEVHQSVEDAMSEVEMLHDELQEWYDNMPENFQNGDRGTTVQEAADAMESIKDKLEEAIEEMDGVEFPGMY